MIIGVPREIKNHEYRVGLTPASVHEFVVHGHVVLVETDAGNGIGASDDVYRLAGADVVDSAEEVFARAELIIKVKEPQASERARLREGQILFTYLHLAPDPEQTRELLDSGAVCIAYETVRSASGGLPLLAPMSMIAGRLAVQAGAWALEHSHGGLGKLLGGVPGVDSARVVIIGGGMVGTHAAHIAVGMGAHTVVLDRSNEVLENHWKQFGRSTQTVFSSRGALEEQVLSADLVIGSVLIPGAAAPKLVSADMIRAMQAGSVVVDVAIDQGGCFATSKPTTHAEPTYVVDDVIHYCVANMPGAVPRTSTHALNNATLPYALALADKGYRRALLDDPGFGRGLNVHAGVLTQQAVAEVQSLDWQPVESVLGA